MKTIVEQMIEAGYRKFTPSSYYHAKEAYQARIRDEVGTRYFITCYIYNFSDLAQEPQEDSYSFEVQYDSHGNQTFDVRRGGWFGPNKWNHPYLTLREIEDFFGLIWETTGRLYYEKDEY
jgi:hypothetical protein